MIKLNFDDLIEVHWIGDVQMNPHIPFLVQNLYTIVEFTQIWIH